MDAGRLEFPNHFVLDFGCGDDAGFKGEVFGAGRTVEKEVEGNVVENKTVMGGFTDEDGADRPIGEDGTEFGQGLALCEICMEHGTERREGEKPE